MNYNFISFFCHNRNKRETNVLLLLVPIHLPQLFICHQQQSPHARRLLNVCAEERMQKVRMQRLLFASSALDLVLCTRRTSN